MRCFARRIVLRATSFRSIGGRITSSSPSAMNPDKGVGFHAYFTNHPSFRHWEGLFYQSGTAQQDFEREYTALRTTEGRLLPDAVVRTLPNVPRRSEEHTSELQSRENLVCRLLLEKKK